MAFPTIPTAAVGGLHSASVQNNVYAMISALLSPPRCQAYLSAGIACPDGTATRLNWDAELYDVDWGGAAGAMHSTSTNTSRVVLPYDGTYNVRWFWSWPSSPSSCTANLRLNAAGSATGGTSMRSPIYTDRTGEHHITRAFSAGDYLEVFMTQNSGASVTISSGAHVTGIDVKWVGA